MSILIIWIFYLISASTAIDSDFKVTINAGTLKGHLLKTANEREFIGFEGIPYAQPPIGNLRFEPPRPVKPWIGVWQATTLRRCLQYDEYTQPGEDFVKGEEDCLYVNVYIPKNIESTPKLLNVIVYIHGGAFMFTHGGSYGPGPKYLLDRDVVYVTFNYRLGPLGFLSTEDNVLPGNNGIRDQQLALKWIKDNIKYFNGNPDSVTITGMSAGGASVHLHTLSPLSKGLFNRVIAQSGSMLNPWVLTEKSSEKAKKLASILGCPTESHAELLSCLKGRSGVQIVGAVKYFLKWLYNPFTPFGIVIDTWATNTVLPEHPLMLIKHNKVVDVPIIFSFVACEGFYPAADYLADKKSFEDINARWNELIPHILDYNYTVPNERHDEVSVSIRKKYFNEKPVNEETYLTLVNLMSERLFTKDIIEAAKLQSSAIKSSVYGYIFSYKGRNSLTQIQSKRDSFPCAGHGDDTAYVLATPIETQTTASDKRMSNILIDLWTSFANNGVPKVKDVKWISVSKNIKDPIQLLHIESPDDIKMQLGETYADKPFWDSLPFIENYKM